MPTNASPAITPGPRAVGTAALALLGALLTAGCERRSAPGVWQGYVEGEYVYVAAPLGGQLVSLMVARGQTAQPDQPLFQLDASVESASVREAESRLLQARDRLANLRKGRRPSELAAIAAQLDQAKASLAFAEADLQRRQKLIVDHVIAPAELEVVQTRRETDAAQVQALQAELETAHLGAREDEVRAGEAEVASLTAALVRAQWALDQKRQNAPTNAVVHDTLYRPGEYVAPGMPVVALLPPASLKVRFFVPETELATVRVGAPAHVSIDGEPAPLPGAISYISTQPEFTPPVIYSQENRAKLVFMVEARLDPGDAPKLHPGQPVEVRLEGRDHP